MILKSMKQGYVFFPFWRWRCVEMQELHVSVVWIYSPRLVLCFVQALLAPADKAPRLIRSHISDNYPIQEGSLRQRGTRPGHEDLGNGHRRRSLNTPFQECR